jgi:3-oxoacyl-[acyl-carrier protein] reductase
MELGLAGKTAIVAASSKGLGKACALALAAEGAGVTVCARTEADLDAAAAEIRAATAAQVLAVPADLATAAGIDRVVAETIATFGGVDVLVTNSGGPPRGTFAEFGDAEWVAAFELVTLGFVRFVRAVLPHMRAGRWGRIIAIHSTSVKQPVGNIDLSNGIRPGIAGLVKAMAPGLARDGITINLVLPGSFRTERMLALLADLPAADAKARLAALGSAVPMGRLGEPAELGSLVAFLASVRAAYITGAAYQVDGGAIASNV